MGVRVPRSLPSIASVLRGRLLRTTKVRALLASPTRALVPADPGPDLPSSGLGSAVRSDRCLASEQPHHTGRQTPPASFETCTAPAGGFQMPNPVRSLER